ncbi:MAG: alkaline phosphatase family protein [Actinomycetes bacterium]
MSGTAKIMLVLLDGAADRQQAALDGRTPLEAASTPNLDALAAAGSSARMYPIAPGIAPSSQQAHWSLFGYEQALFPGRGYFEALGEGLDPKPGEVVVRANLARVERGDGAFAIVERPDPRSGEADLEGVDLNAFIDGVSCEFTFTDHLQGLLTLRPAVGALSHQVSDADPLATGWPVVAIQPFEEAADKNAAARTANVLNEWMLLAHERLVGRRLDFMLLKWPGAKPGLPSFAEKFGLRGASLGAGPLYAGLARALGMAHVDMPADLRVPRHDLSMRIEVGTELLRSDVADFVHVHTKVPDHVSHKKDPALKVEALEALDQALGELVASRIWGPELVVAVTADHATPSSGGLYHSGEAVPLVVVGGAAGSDGVSAFCESACGAGVLGQIVGTDLMPVLLNAADRTGFLGDRLTGRLMVARPRREDVEPLAPRS